MVGTSRHVNKPILPWAPRGPYPRPARLTARRRRGVAALWLILSLPVLVILLGVVIEIGNIWLARVELENALEAAALSAVKEWGDQGTPATQPARNVGVTYAAANTVTGDPVGIDPNYDLTEANNQNDSCSGNLIFGAVTTNTVPWVFDTRVQPGCGVADPAFGVRAQATAPVNSVCCRLFGATLNTFNVSACATARYVCTSNRPELIRVRPENFICPP